MRDDWRAAPKGGPFVRLYSAAELRRQEQDPEGKLREDRLREPPVSRVREARLRPEFAHLYPGLAPGVWEDARELADRLLAQHALQPSPGYMLSDRILPENHFDFREGDPPRGTGWRGARSRLNDR